MRRIALLLTLALVALFALCACSVSTAQAPDTLTGTTTHTTLAEVPIGPPPTCRVTPTDTAGCDPREAVVAEQTRSTFEACRGQNSGKLTVQVHVVDRRVVVDAWPQEAILNPLDRQCIYDGLQRIYVDDNPTLNSGGAGIPPSGFTSLITLEF